MSHEMMDKEWAKTIAVSTLCANKKEWRASHSMLMSRFWQARMGATKKLDLSSVDLFAPCNQQESNRRRVNGRSLHCRLHKQI